MKRWPLDKAYVWETAPFFRLLLPLISGIVAYELTWRVPLNGPALAASASIALAGYIATLFFSKEKLAHSPVPFVLLCYVLFAVGYSLSWYNDSRNDPRWLGKHLSSPAFIARISGAPADRAQSVKMTVSLIAACDSHGSQPVTGQALVYLDKQASLSLHAGDTVVLTGAWQPVTNAGNPYEFDYAGYCRRNNVYFRQFATAKDIRLFAAADPTIVPRVTRMHNWCMSQLDAFIPGRKAKGLLQAMLLGDEVNLDEDLRSAYAQTGIIHIIAISGGNVAIFFIVISFLLMWLRHKRYNWIKYLIALPMVWLYVIMAGSSPSAVRAAVMFSLLAFGILMQKNNNSLNQLFATAFLLLCAQPAWLFSLGFQLSFVAVLSIILFYPPVYRCFQPGNRITRALWQTVAASIAAEVLVAPLVIYYFHLFPLMFIIANVAAYLFMGIVLILGMLVIVLSWIPAAASALGIATGLLVDWFGKVVSFLQQLNPAAFQRLVLSAFELALLYAVIGGVLLFLAKRRKPALFTGLAAACLLMLSLCRDEWIALRQQHIVVYNTGRDPYSEFVSGHTASVIRNYAVNEDKIAYATQPAHIHWRIHDILPASRRAFYINGRTVLFLDAPAASFQSFPVDYLVINSDRRYLPRMLKQVFSPSLVIQAGAYPPRQQKQFLADCQLAGLAVYPVRDSGSFIVH